MDEQIQHIMTTELQTVRTDASLSEVACLMRDHEIGDVLVTDEKGHLCGIVTDRDIVVRAAARRLPFDTTPVREVCTEAILQVRPTESIEETVRLMRRRSIRRMPVVRTDGVVVGIVSLGDLAREYDPHSALGQISKAPATS